MKVKRWGITEILRSIWLSFANKIKSSKYFSKQPTQLILILNSSLQHIIVTKMIRYLCIMYFSTYISIVHSYKFFGKGKRKQTIYRPDTYDETFHSFLKLCPSTFLFQLSRFTSSERDQ